MLIQAMTAILAVGVVLLIVVLISRRVSEDPNKGAANIRTRASRDPAPNAPLLASTELTPPLSGGGGGIESMRRVLEDMRRGGIDDDTIRRYEALIERARHVVTAVAPDGSDELMDDDEDPPHHGTSHDDLPGNIDPAYGDIPAERVPEYQVYIDECLRSVNVDNFTQFTAGKEFNMAQKDADDATLEGIIVNKAARDRLSPAVLQVMVWQFFAADIILREMDRQRWAARVMRPDRDVNYFPSPHAVRRTFFEEG